MASDAREPPRDPEDLSGLAWRQRGSWSPSSGSGGSSGATAQSRRAAAPKRQNREAARVARVSSMIRVGVDAGQSRHRVSPATLRRAAGLVVVVVVDLA